METIKAQDATVIKLQKSSGLVDWGNLGATAEIAGQKGQNTRNRNPKVVNRKPEIQAVFDHARQLLMNDLFLENYFMLFGKRKDRVIIDIPVDDK